MRVGVVERHFRSGALESHNERVGAGLSTGGGGAVVTWTPCAATAGSAVPTSPISIETEPTNRIARRRQEQ